MLIRALILFMLILSVFFQSACFGLNEEEKKKLQEIKSKIIKMNPKIEEQFKFERVAQAYLTHWENLELLLKSKHINPQHLEIHLRAFKLEEELEVWGRSKSNEPFQLLKTYAFCTNSGQLGPKRCEGDQQIPEGLYQIQAFNPKSRFHLSLKVNYPNASDLKQACPDHPGSDIMVHGGCASIGCISITDDSIKEVYLLALHAFHGGHQKIEIHIFPAKLDQDFMEKIEQRAQEAQSKWMSKNELIRFWQKLKINYDRFEKNHSLSGF